eukprot:5051521-Amphidinium_carterae.1
MAVHHKSGEPLPKSALDKVVGSAAVGSARALLWAAVRSALDIAVHSKTFSARSSVKELLDLEHTVLRRFAAPLPQHDACWYSLDDKGTTDHTTSDACYVRTNPSSF